MASIVLYMSENCSGSRAVLMTARALGLSLEIHVLNAESGDTKSKEFSKINPMRTLPTIVDDDFSLWESRTIVKYLADKYGKDDTMYPKELRERMLIDRLLCFDNTVYNTIARWLYPKIPPSFIGRSEQSRDYELKVILDRLEKIVLAKTDFVTGDNVTIADIHLVASVTLLEELNFDVKSWKKVRAWINRCKELPYYEEFQAGDD